jgi:hypothetical protein
MSVKEFADWWGFYHYKSALKDQALARAKLESE